MLALPLVLLASSFLLARPTNGREISQPSNPRRSEGEVEPSQSPILMESKTAAPFELGKHQVRILFFHILPPRTNTIECRWHNRKLGQREPPSKLSSVSIVSNGLSLFLSENSFLFSQLQLAEGEPAADSGEGEPPPCHLPQAAPLAGQHRPQAQKEDKSPQKAGTTICSEQEVLGSLGPDIWFEASPTPFI